MPQSEEKTRLFKTISTNNKKKVSIGQGWRKVRIDEETAESISNDSLILNLKNAP